MTKLMTQNGYNNQMQRIAGLEAEVQRIQRQVGEVTSQSSETWHDNSPYDVLIGDLRIANRRLSDEHQLLEGYQIEEYPKTLREKVVRYGTKVKFKIDNQQKEYCIVGYGESDFDKGCILYQCPLAKVLIGKRKGDQFTAQVNEEKHCFNIEDVLPIENDLIKKIL